MGKLRSNFFMGIRTPWTLSSQLPRNRTHRLAGGLFVLYAIVVVLLGRIGNMNLLPVLSLPGRTWAAADRLSGAASSEPPRRIVQ